MSSARRPPHPDPLPQGGEGTPTRPRHRTILPRRSGYRYPAPRPLPKSRRRKSSIGSRLRATVHKRPWQIADGKFEYPKVCLSGLWLEDAGFLIGQRFEIEVSEGRLVLRTV